MDQNKLQENQLQEEEVKNITEEESGNSENSENSENREEEKELTPKERRRAEKEARWAARPRFYSVMSWVITIGIAVGIVAVINFVIVVNSIVPSGSMETTIMSHSRMLGLRTAYWFSEPERGDVVVFRYPDDPSQLFVKRVIGLPGETVEVIDGETFINGELLEEDYINPDYRLSSLEYEDYGPYVVPEKSYFMMGDNRGNSRDSRFWTNTFVEKDALVGKAWLCYWPFSRFGVIH